MSGFTFFNANVGGPLVVFNSRSITFEKITISASPFKPYYKKQPSLLWIRGNRMGKVVIVCKMFQLLNVIPRAKQE